MAATAALTENSVGAATSVKSDPDDEDDVVVAGDLVEAVDDRPHGPLGRGVQVVVGDAARLLTGGRRAAGTTGPDQLVGVRPARTMGRNTPTRPAPAAQLVGSPTATADLPDCASVPAM